MHTREELINIIRNRFTQAPVAGYTDYPFRKIARKYGCAGLIFSEMVSARGLLSNFKVLSQILRFDEEDRPVGVQLFGNDPGAFEEAAGLIEEKIKPDIIDINMGCPARKIMKGSGGAMLLKRPKLAEEIIKRTSDVLKNTPLSIKTRTGWEYGDSKSVEIIRSAEEHNLLCVFLHLRPKKGLFSGSLEYDIYLKLKKQFLIPIISNGGIFFKNDYLNTIEKIQPDGIMIGRGGFGNPWIYGYPDPDFKEPDIGERIEAMFLHLELICRYYGEERGVLKFRKLIKPYLRGIKNNTAILPELVLMKNKNDIIEKINNWLKNI